MPKKLLDPEGAEDEAGAPEIPNPLEGWEWKGSRGPATTLKEEMIAVIARALAETGFLRVAAARAGCTEDALSAWLARGEQQVKARKRSIYTRLLSACQEAWAHHASFMLKLGDRTVLDRHTNPRWVTWKLSVMGSTFRVPKEGPSGQGQGLGPAFELQSPAEAATALEEKMAHFLATQVRVEKILAEAAVATPEANEPASPPAAEEG
ncbi:MAG: hypothetical protein ACJ8AT_06240 [Hyalangium sp.]